MSPRQLKREGAQPALSGAKCGNGLAIPKGRPRISLRSIRATIEIVLFFDMTVEELAKAVTELRSDELAKFRAWFETFDAAGFDQKIEREARAGKLDQLAEKAVTDLKRGRARKL